MLFNLHCLTMRFKFKILLNIVALVNIKYVKIHRYTNKKKHSYSKNRIPKNYYLISSYSVEEINRIIEKLLAKRIQRNGNKKE